MCVFSAALVFRLRSLNLHRLNCISSLILIEPSRWVLFLVWLSNKHICIFCISCFNSSSLVVGAICGNDDMLICVTFMASVNEIIL